MATFTLRDSVAVVTGGAQGIGLELARRLVHGGAHVTLIDTDADRLESARVPLARDGMTAGPGTADPVHVIVADVRDRRAMEDAVEETAARWGRVDLVVANAGVTPPPATLRTTDPAEFDRVIDINLTGALNTVLPALPDIIRTKGHVVVVSSSAAYCPGLGGAAYMASKAASEQLGRALRVELAPHGATASVAYFGFVDTGLARATLDDDPLGARVGDLLPWPMNRRVTPQHAAEVVVRGIRRRAPRTTTPRLWGVYSVLRGIVNPIIDGCLVRDGKVRELVIALEGRRTTAGTESV